MPYVTVKKPRQPGYCSNCQITEQRRKLLLRALWTYESVYVYGLCVSNKLQCCCTVQPKVQRSIRYEVKLMWLQPQIVCAAFVCTACAWHGSSPLTLQRKLYWSHLALASGHGLCSNFERSLENNEHLSIADLRREHDKIVAQHCKGLIHPFGCHASASVGAVNQWQHAEKQLHNLPFILASNSSCSACSLWSHQV